MPAPTGAEVWRDYVTNGVPSSGRNEPKKTEIRDWARAREAAEGALTMMLGASQGAVKGTKAALDAVVGDFADGDVGVVYADTDALSGVYVKSGGMWTKVRDLPDVAAEAAAAEAEAAAAASQVASDESEAARDLAEAYRDQAAGYVSDIASEKEVPIVTTIDGVTAISIPSGMTVIRTSGRAVGGDGGAWPLVVEVANSGTLEPWQRQSNSGTRRWELVTDRPDPRMFAALAADNVTDDAVGFNRAAAYALAKGLKTIAVPSGNYAILTPSRDLYKVALVGDGTVSGAYALSVRTSEGTRAPIFQDINPERHLRKLLAKNNVKVVFAGDSLSTPFTPDGYDDPRDNLAENIKRWLRNAFPGKKFTFVNRSIGAQRWVDFGSSPGSIPANIDWYAANEATTTRSGSGTTISVASAAGIEVGMYAWGTGIPARATVTAIAGTDITLSSAASAGTSVAVTFRKQWAKIVADENADLVFMGFGMNDGALWNSGNFQPDWMMRGLSAVLHGRSRPDVVLITNIKPSLSTSNADYNSDASQIGRDAVAGYVRSIGKFHDLPIIDLNRAFGILRDGRDIMETYFDLPETISGAMPLSPTYRVTDFIADIEVQSIAADFFLAGGTDVPTLSLSGVPGDNESVIYFVKIGTKIGIQIYGDRWNASNILFVTDVDAPTTGETFAAKVALVGNRLTVDVMGTQVFDDEIVRHGGDFVPYWIYANNSATPNATMNLMRGRNTRHVPSITDLDIYSTGLGGNGLNHPNARAMDILYGATLANQRLYGAPEDAAIAQLHGLDGLSLDLISGRYALSIGGNLTVGNINDLVTSSGAWLGGMTALVPQFDGVYRVGCLFSAGEGATINLSALFGGAFSECLFAAEGYATTAAVTYLAAVATTSNNGARVQMRTDAGGVGIVESIAADSTGATLNTSRSFLQTRRLSIRSKADDFVGYVDGDFLAHDTGGAIPTAHTTLKLAHIASSGETAPVVLSKVVIVPSLGGPADAMRLSLN